jgi:hypothetical protein
MRGFIMACRIKESQVFPPTSCICRRGAVFIEAGAFAGNSRGESEGLNLCTRRRRWCNCHSNPRLAICKIFGKNCAIRLISTSICTSYSLSTLFVILAHHVNPNSFSDRRGGLPRSCSINELEVRWGFFRFGRSRPMQTSDHRECASAS